MKASPLPPGPLRHAAGLQPADLPTVATARRCRSRLGGIGLLAALLGANLAAAPAQAQQAGYGQTLGGSATPQERQLFGNGGSGPGSGSGAPIDARNPLDLINQLRRGSAMDDATPPGTAVDRALRDLEATTAPVPPAAGKPPGGGLTGI